MFIDLTFDIVGKSAIIKAVIVGVVIVNELHCKPELWSGNCFISFISSLA